MTIDPEKRSQELIEIIDEQFHKMANCLELLESKLLDKKSKHNLDSKDSQGSPTKDVAIVIGDNLDSEEIESLREEVEFLHELVDSLNLLLLYKEQELQEIASELEEINCDNMTAFITQPYAYLTLEDAKKLASTLLTSKKSANASLAELLTTIYGSKVNPDELNPIDELSTKVNSFNYNAFDEIIARSQELKAQSKQLRATYHEMGSRFITFKAHYAKLELQWTNFRATKKKNQIDSNNFKISEIYTNLPMD
ncbi:hypothetical protein [Scytonema sp. NUACC26]|uniref:hypothetical protein n=1 Tax=Scytonema sp. NUACC26 TaxID=3140176 RepID=UPI0034DBAEB8